MTYCNSNRVSSYEKNICTKTKAKSTNFPTNLYGVPEPVSHIFFRTSELIPQAHTDHVSDAAEHCGHLSKALNPKVRVKVPVAEEPVAIKVAATPTRLANVIIEYDHHIVVSEA